MTKKNICIILFFTCAITNLIIILLYCKIYNLSGTPYQIISFLLSIAFFLYSILKLIYKKSKKHLEFFLLPAIVFIQMETSISNALEQMGFWSYVWNLLTTISIFLMSTIFFKKRQYLGKLLFLILFLIWGLTNYYTLTFRNLPLAPQDFSAAGTALNVIGNYKFKITWPVIVIISWFIYGVFGVCLCRNTNKLSSNISLFQIILRDVIKIVVITSWFIIGFFSPIKNVTGLNHIGNWDWKVGYFPNGYISTTFASAFSMRTIKPIGYDESKIKDWAAEMEAVNHEKASNDINIILIINESMYDWHQVLDYTTDKEVMPFFNNLENCVRGYAVNPRTTTAISEYEILTSNSTSLTPNMNPFTQINFSKMHTIVSHLKGLGFWTAAMHLAPGTNYNRSVVYPQLGFDEIQFSEPQKTYEMVKGFVSDEESFKTLIHLFESKPKNISAFLYCLTIQNHGWYKMSIENGGTWKIDPDKKVSITSNFKSGKAEMEEYLSALQYTDEAFARLINYFKNQEEKVVICMVGDHEPVLQDIDYSCINYTNEERLLHQAGTPFIIWANYPIESKNVGYIGMVSLMPLVLDTAGIAKCVYYNSLEKLQDITPVIYYSFYMDKIGEYHKYSADMPLPLLRYLSFEYINMISGTKNTIVFDK